MVVRSYSHTPKFLRLDGLLLFCIIMGLRSASSAVKIHSLHLLPLASLFLFISSFSDVTEPNWIEK